MSVDEVEEGPSELEVAEAETAAAKADAEAVEAALELSLELLKSSQRDLVIAEAQISALQIQVDISRFGLQRFQADDDSIKFYTGFPSYNDLLQVYGLLEPSAERMTYIYSAGKNVQESRPSARTMVLIDQFFFISCKGKGRSFAQDLAHRFNIHIATVSRKIITWANFLYFFLGNQVIWASKEEIDSHMTEDFKRLYPKTRVILDCTEIYVQSPSSLLSQSQLYSTYKSSTTLKGLVGIAPLRLLLLYQPFTLDPYQIKK